MIAILSAAFAVWLAVAPNLPDHKRPELKPPDDYRTKYEQVEREMTLPEVTQLLGRPAYEFHPGGSLGDHEYSWTDDGEWYIVVTWDVFGEYKYKELKHIGGQGRAGSSN